VYFFPHVASNIAYVRAIGQFFSIEYLRKRGEKADEHEILKQFYETFSHTDKKLNMVKKFDEVLSSFDQILNNFDIRVLLTTPFDEFGEIMHDSVTDRLKAECVEMMAIIKLVKGISCIENLIDLNRMMCHHQRKKNYGSYIYHCMLKKPTRSFNLLRL